ncbi:solute carrier family 25 member 36-A-like [Watersipora subatra]|uniref:solute carrier family 25 member 36-A-like n=1 Tax=Watersipora subatra TaxID=2589382 RepID=UPI00355BD2E6
MGDCNPLVNLFAGGVGGTVGAIVTSPLDVVKTRLQSSGAQWTAPKSLQPTFKCPTTGLPIDPATTRKFLGNTTPLQYYSTVSPATQLPRLSLFDCLRFIHRHEGIPGLFRGLGPNLVGVAPSRAIYFCAYAKSKEIYSHSTYITSYGNSMVHLLSAATGGFICCSLTNPIWFLKTRLQLDSKKGISKLTVLRCIREVYKENGIKGFYRGITASYLGISETVLNFVIYEKLKEKILVHGRTVDMENDRTAVDFGQFMLAGAMSKTIACITFYPHEVARTRLREAGSVYTGLFQTLSKVVIDEGFPGLYKGLSAQLLRAIPNTAIMLCTYELVVYTLTPGCKRSNCLDEE